MSAILTVQNVEKSFGNRRVLDRASFAVHEQDRIGVVGLNGAGKSTLLRMLVAGRPGDDPKNLPDAGLITKQRDLTVEYLAQEPALDPELTVFETLQGGLRAHAAVMEKLSLLEATIAGRTGTQLDAALREQAALHHRIELLGGWDQDHEIRGLARSLDLPPMEARIAPLSGGERRRVALARALLARPELLALDEPTNHLDTDTVAWLETRLEEYPGALLLVTHDRYFLDRVATRILELDRGGAYMYEGGYTRFLELQAERLAGETERERARASFVRRELDWIRRGPAARTTKQQARIDRFNTAVSAKPTADDRRPDRMTLKLPMGGRLGKTILELFDVGKSIGNRKLFSGLTLAMKPGDRIGIVGPNGVGKTTLIRTIMGELTPDEGQVNVGKNTIFSYLDQGRADLKAERTVLDEVSDGDDQVFLEDGPIHVRTFLRMLLFDDGFANAPIGTLSGGERNRVQLAKLLRKGGNLLVLDEPTNDLDLVTLGVLEDALVEFPGCALVVSHDRWFLDKVATAILAFEDGRFVLYEGDYSSYANRRAKRLREGATNAQAAPVESPLAATKPTPTAPVRKLSFKEKRELAGMEATILEAEARAEVLKTTLNDPTIYKTRAQEVPALIAELDALRTEVERLYARWQELEALGK